MPVGVVPTPAIAFFAQRDDAAGRGHLGESQRVDRQRREADGGRWPQASRRGRSRDRRRTRARSCAGHDPTRCRGVGSCATASTSTSSISRPRSRAARSTGCASSSTARTAPRRRVAPRALRHLGADVVVLHAEPDGRNINEQCGSTYPESLQAAVRRRTEPKSGSPSTVTPTASSRSTSAASSSTATRS